MVFLSFSYLVRVRYGELTRVCSGYTEATVQYCTRVSYVYITGPSKTYVPEFCTGVEVLGVGSLELKEDAQHRCGDGVGG